MKGVIVALVSLAFLLNFGSCSNEKKEKIENDSVIREYISQWQMEHPNYLIRSKVAKVDDACLCYAMEFIKKEEERTGFFEGLKNKVKIFEDERFLKNNIEHRIKILLPQGWHVYVEDGENACKWRCE